MNKVTDGEGRNGIKGQFREADRSLHFSKAGSFALGVSQ